jgi:DNA mismatch repair protein MutL
MLIDLKRALERILYDASIGTFVKQPLHTQMLLFPVEKELDKQEIRVIQSHLGLLEQLGFKLELKESNLLISGAPEILHEQGILACIDSLIIRLETQDQQREDLAHILMVEMVRSSVKHYPFGNKLEMQQLVEQLFHCQEHHLSPSQETIITIIRHENLHQFLP